MLLKKNKTVLDKLGIITSVACAIHCTVFPLLLSSLPFLGINLVHNKLIEYGTIGLAFVFGIFSLRHGNKAHPQGPLPIFLFSAGFFLLLLNQLTAERWVCGLIPVAAACIISAHVLRIRACKIKPTC